MPRTVQDLRRRGQPHNQRRAWAKLGHGLQLYGGR